MFGEMITAVASDHRLLPRRGGGTLIQIKARAAQGDADGRTAQEALMSAFEVAFLTLVVTSFGLFALVLAGTAWHTRDRHAKSRHPDHDGITPAS
jgi:hypothetical protein